MVVVRDPLSGIVGVFDSGWEFVLRREAVIYRHDDSA